MTSASEASLASSITRPVSPMAHQLSASVQGFVGLPARCSSKGQTVAVALRSGAPRRDSTLRPRTLCLSSRAVLRGAALGNAVERCRRPVVARSAVHTTALFKQTTSKVQWSTVVLTAACLAAAVAMLVRPGCAAAPFA